MTDQSGGFRMERDQVVEALCDHYAADHLLMEEFERRVSAVHRATSPEELQALLSDLPALEGGAGAGLVAGSGAAGGSGPAGAAGAGTGRGSGQRSGPGQADAYARGATGYLPTRADPSQVRNSQVEVAIFSGRSRKGGWTPARTIRCVAMMGGVELDFREASFPPGEIRVHALAVMGGVEILVPPGVRVETDGVALLGGFEEDLDADSGSNDPDAPVIRVTGLAMLGAVEVASRYPGESPRQARRRRKELQRQQEEERRRLGPGG